MINENDIVMYIIKKLEILNGDVFNPTWSITLNTYDGLERNSILKTTFDVELKVHEVIDNDRIVATAESIAGVDPRGLNPGNALYLVK